MCNICISASLNVQNTKNLYVQRVEYRLWHYCQIKYNIFMHIFPGDERKNWNPLRSGQPRIDAR